MIRGLVIDDHEMFAEALVRILAQDPEIEVIGSVGTARAGLEQATTKQPDIVLMDLVLPDDQSSRSRPRRCSLRKLKR